MGRQIGLAMQRFGPQAGMLAYALLRDRLTTITADKVASVFKETLNRPVKVERIGGNPSVFGFLVSIGELHLSVTCSKVPYVPPGSLATFAGQFANAETRKRVAAHTCFVSVEMPHVAPELVKEAMPVLSRVAGAFVDEGTTAIVSTFFQTAVPTTPETAGDFRSGNILGLLGHAAEADQRWNAESQQAALRGAIEEARRRVPEFLEAWATGSGHGMFMIKSAFTENGVTEHMWSKVVSINGDVVVGKLGNRPRHLKNIREGQQHSVSIHELSDWCYAMKGKGEGGFTDPAMRQMLASA